MDYYDNDLNLIENPDLSNKLIEERVIDERSYIVLHDLTEEQLKTRDMAIKNDKKRYEQTQQLNAAASIFVTSNSDALTNEQLISVSSFFPDWETGHKYTKGEIINYNGNLYRIGQDHTSQSYWLPDSDGVTALYSAIKIDEETGYETWKAWDGVSGMYAKDQIVKDPNDGLLYKSTIANNVWGPPSSYAAYWTKVNGE